MLFQLNASARSSAISRSVQFSVGGFILQQHDDALKVLLRPELLGKGHEKRRTRIPRVANKEMFAPHPNVELGRPGIALGRAPPRYLQQPYQVSVAFSSVQFDGMCKSATSCQYPKLDPDASAGRHPSQTSTIPCHTMPVHLAMSTTTASAEIQFSSVLLGSSSFFYMFYLDHPCLSLGWPWLRFFFSPQKMQTHFLGNKSMPSILRCVHRNTLK